MRIAQILTYARSHIEYIQLNGWWRSRWPLGSWSAGLGWSGPAAMAGTLILPVWPRSSMATPSSSTAPAFAWKASTRRKPVRPANAGCSAPGPAARKRPTPSRASVEGKQVRCEPRGLDKYGRTLGVCFLGAAGCERLDGAPGPCLGLRQVLHELCEGRGGGDARCASASGRARQRRPGNIASTAGQAPSRRRRRAAPSRATSPRTARSTTCPGALGTPRSGWIRRKAGAGSAPRPRQWPPAGGR